MRYLVASRHWLDDFRLGDRNVVGLSHYDVFPDLPERWRLIHLRCLAGAVEKCDEDSFPRADGTTDWLRWEVRPWRQADGSIGGIIVFSEDITDRKRAQEAVRESEGRYRTLFENAPDGILIADSRSVYIDAQPQHVRDAGLFQRGTRRASRLRHRVASGGAAHRACARGHPRKRGLPPAVDVPSQERSRPFTRTSLRPRCPTATCSAWCGTSPNGIQAVEALRAAEERMRFALDSAQVGIWDQDYATGVLQ